MWLNFNASPLKWDWNDCNQRTKMRLKWTNQNLSRWLLLPRWKHNCPQCGEGSQGEMFRCPCSAHRPWQRCLGLIQTENSWCAAHIGTPASWAKCVNCVLELHILSKPANYKSICCIMEIIANRFSSDKDVSFVRSWSSHKLHLWEPRSKEWKVFCGATYNVFYFILFSR